ncbi:hypothetical protein GCM10025867_45100 [Frondihabitans sucicola]|uniref:ABC transmembrane type-1 domain-containing protein n=1 Tax=Frondihabitans sucicola TaxID=1268041 RepID=A0ABN6XSM0_9MICO|nr:hypothetical protein GCM10025867_00370 [Frondihabitans sucicola]BDZ52269.1 hypothetical protein GCM10025867_45100 [Frondihabitans sucicola]
MTGVVHFPGSTAVSDLAVYDWETPDGLHGGSPHLHTVSTEAYVVLEGAGELRTLTPEGPERHDLRPGVVLWFAPGTIHRLVNVEGLRILTVMENAGLPEAGDAVLTFPRRIVADPEAYRREAALPSDDTEAVVGRAARARRDLALEGFAELEADFDRRGSVALAEFYDLAGRLVAPGSPTGSASGRVRSSTTQKPPAPDSTPSRAARPATSRVPAWSWPTAAKDPRCSACAAGSACGSTPPEPPKNRRITTQRRADHDISPSTRSTLRGAARSPGQAEVSALGELRNVRKARGDAADRKADTRDNKVAILFLAPWLVGLIGITLGPVLVSLYLAFTNYNLLQAPKFTGLANIQRMLGDERLAHSLGVTFVYVAVGVPLQLMAALALAILLDRGVRGLPVYRSLLYLPSLLGASVAIAVLWRIIFGSNGLVNVVLARFGIDGPAWIADPKTALSTLILLHVWTFGAPMVIFLAGLRQIPREFYEAASTDGASRWRQFRSITLPLLSPIIFFNLVLGIIGAFQSFTQAFVVSGGTGGPSDSTLFYTLYLYQQGFGNFQMGYASALAWFLLVIVGVFTALNFWASKFWVFYDD